MSKKAPDTQTTSSQPWKQLQPYLLGTEGQAGLFPQAESLYGQGPSSYYPGQTYADFNPLQTQGQNASLDYASGAMTDTANSALGANNLMTSGNLLYASSNPYLQQNISDANSLIARDFNEQVMPSLARGGSMNNSYGSSRQGIAEGLAGRGAAEAMTRNTNEMMNQAYGQGLNAMATGVGQAPSVMSAGLAPSAQMMDIGAQQQAMQQQGITEDVNRYNYNQQAPWDNLARYQSMLTGNYLGAGGTSSVPVTSDSPIGAAIGGGLAGYGVGGPWGAAIGAAGGLLS